MTVFSIILGVLLIIGGFSCMFTPLATFLSTGYFLGILMLVYGISGIIRGFQKKAQALEVVISVLAVIVGLISLFRPGSTLIFDQILIYVIASWFTLQGIFSIVLAFQVKEEKKGWYWGLIVGILGVIVGLYSFAHPIFTAVTAGILIGCYFVEAGFSMIMLAAAINEME
jgi:uncharacterized membrane protein HdeD (DUF308 family)